MPCGVEQVARAFDYSRRGLYAGRVVLSGNRISEDSGTGELALHSSCHFLSLAGKQELHHVHLIWCSRTRRVCKPNVQTMRL